MIKLFLFESFKTKAFSRRPCLIMDAASSHFHLIQIISFIYFSFDDLTFYSIFTLSHLSNERDYLTITFLKNYCKVSIGITEGYMNEYLGKNAMWNEMI